MLEVARHAVLGTVAAAWMDLVALDLPDLASSTACKCAHTRGVSYLALCLMPYANAWHSRQTEKMRTSSRLLVGSPGGHNSGLCGVEQFVTPRILTELCGLPVVIEGSMKKVTAILRAPASIGPSPGSVARPGDPECRLHFQEQAVPKGGSGLRACGLCPGAFGVWGLGLGTVCGGVAAAQANQHGRHRHPYHSATCIDLHKWHYRGEMYAFTSGIE
ncbi:hypothetical protein NUW58_g6983 [Xylaria curta]|uniref:Uncharacterized protein n=1 Tax=Xylaria curta TaxID=42375 RepID=A0ACC1NLS9_9PEZI|nr:hypothetical protein NUW58_g6983 [Xylaria curta]